MFGGRTRRTAAIKAQNCDERRGREFGALLLSVTISWFTLNTSNVARDHAVFVDGDEVLGPRILSNPAKSGKRRSP